MKRKLSRRHLIKKTVKSASAAAVVPYLIKPDIRSGFAAPQPGKMSLKEYYDYFEVNEKMIREVMAAALSKGGDYCDIYFQHLTINYIGLEDNAVNRASSNIDYGVGIRVLKGDQTGYSFSEEITMESMKRAAQTASGIANTSGRITPVSLQLQKHPDYHPVKTPWETVSINQKIPFLQKINKKIFKLDKRILKTRISFTDETSYVLIATSDGKVACDYRPAVTVSVRVSAEQKGRREENYYSLSGRKGLEILTPENVNRLAKIPVERTIRLFDAVKPGAGEMEVVLAAGSSGILLHEAIGHGMEADFNRKNISIFSDKIGKPVARDFVTIIDDGTTPNDHGSLNIDDEGNNTEKTFLVKDGILRSYLHDRISSKYYKTKPTGNGRRQTFRHTPMPRMRNTYMLPGPHTKEEIIKSVKNGLYAETFTNGEVHIGAGDFTFYVKNGHLIKNGRITKPVKDVNIIGNGPEVLRNIVMVGDDLKISESGSFCGKDGQRARVSLGLPTVKVSKITVGGINE